MRRPDKREHEPVSPPRDGLTVKSLPTSYLRSSHLLPRARWLTEPLAEPASPTQLKVKVTGLSIVRDSDPAIDLVPDQFPDALQLLAAVEDQLRVIVLPRLTLEGLAPGLTVGTCTVGGSVTVTVTPTVSLPRLRL